MIPVKSKILFMTACILEALWLLLAQVAGSMLLLIPCLVCFLALVFFASVQNIVMPVLMFFLPFAPLLKIQPGTVSFFTIAMLGVYMVYTVLGSRNIRIYHLVPGLILIALILIVKTVSGYPMNSDVILFAASLCLVPFLVRDLDGKYDFFWLTVFFALGISLAAITAQELYGYSTIRRYIETHVLFGVVRYSGYYGDPNFYSSHISAALSGVLVMMLNNENRKRMIVLFAMTLLLLYCGFLSVSKSFLLVSMCLLVFFGIEFLFRKGKLSLKVMMVLTFLIGAVFLLSLTAFTELVDMMLERLSRDRTLSDFTTGRIELWVQYLNVLKEDPALLFFGKGYSNVLVNDRASHNTIIQIVYQLGLTGGICLVLWMISYIRTLMAGKKIQGSNLVQLALLLIGVFGPWMALDFLFFDEFFLCPVYLCFALRSVNSRTENEVLQLQ